MDQWSKRWVAQEDSGEGVGLRPWGSTLSWPLRLPCVSVALDSGSEPVLGLGKGSSPLPVPGWSLALEGTLGWDIPFPRLSSRCPWEQAPSCLQELDALPSLILNRALYKGRKQLSRPGAGSGEERQPGGAARAWGGNEPGQWPPPPSEPLAQCWGLALEASTFQPCWVLPSAPLALSLPPPPAPWPWHFVIAHLLSVLRP